MLDRTVQLIEQIAAQGASIKIEPASRLLIVGRNELSVEGYRVHIEHDQIAVYGEGNTIDQALGDALQRISSIIRSWLFVQEGVEDA